MPSSLLGRPTPAYLAVKAIAGDSRYLWVYDQVCTLDRVLAEGKCAAEDGNVPRAGA